MPKMRNDVGTAERKRKTPNAELRTPNAEVRTDVSSRDDAQCKWNGDAGTSDVDALVGQHCRPDEPREFGHELDSRFVTDVRADVHVRRRHADAAWRNFSALHQRDHAPRRRSDRR